jgi:poly-gamma-glutamate synthesis protein (capsule biosynthesis protein)
MVTIALGGDTMLGRMVGAAIEERPPASVWDPALVAVFGEADAAIVNLECCISSRGEPWPDPAKPFFFRAPPRAIEALTTVGVRAVWLGNNHALDYGSVALLDTFDHLAAAGIAWAGAGPDLASARRGAVIQVAGSSFGLAGFADHPADFAAGPDQPGIAWVSPDELERSGPPPWLVDEVRRLVAEADHVIVGPHWGPNMNPWPLAHHRPLARRLVEAGASALAGHSAHVPQGVGRLGTVPLCYDLGDLVDDYAVDADVRNDLGILALWTPGARLELVPLKLEYTRTGLATGAEHAWLVDGLRRRSRDEGAELRLEDGRLVLDLQEMRGGPRPEHLFDIL